MGWIIQVVAMGMLNIGVGYLGASHSKSLEFLLVPLTQNGGTNFKVLTVFLFQKIIYLLFLAAFFYVLICIMLWEILSGFSLFVTPSTSSCMSSSLFVCVTDNTHNIFVFVLWMILVEQEIFNGNCYSL